MASFYTKITFLWKTMWKNVCRDCEFVVDKIVEKLILESFGSFSCGKNSGFHGFSVRVAKKCGENCGEVLQGETVEFFTKFTFSTYPITTTTNIYLERAFK
ncbi:hypothetical protein IKF63_00215 [Candidatus Saccharibacteria bacterium]|nr:hypothetical protein [Candidatus Saccharibacteria bacterium]